MNKDYSIPLGSVRREHVVVNSRFIATLEPVPTIEAARAFLSRIRHEFSDATHNVPAYIIGGGNTVTDFCSDDGEPAGTAGKPILAVLRGSGLGDVAVVVTRYFGGTLLGTGGLVKAYTESAQMVVNAVERGRQIEAAVAMLAIPYNLLERLRLLVNRNKGEVLNEEYAGDITLTIQIPAECLDAFQNSLREMSAGKLQAIVVEFRSALTKI